MRSGPKAEKTPSSVLSMMQLAARLILPAAADKDVQRTVSRLARIAVNRDSIE